MDLGAINERLDGYESGLRIHHIPKNSRLFYKRSSFQPGLHASAMRLDLCKNRIKEIDRIEPPTQLNVRGSTSSPKDKAG